jgi:Protein of unknown function (DUF3445)
VLDTADWYTPTDGTAAPRPADPIRDFNPAALYLRVERETLRRFAPSNAVLFTIRTYVTPIPAVAGESATAQRLAAALAALPDPVRLYKDVASFGPALIAHLSGSDCSAEVDTI